MDKKEVKSDNICQFHKGDKVIHIPEVAEVPGMDYKEVLVKMTDE